MKKVLLRNHLQLVTHCLKEEQGNSEVSSDQGNKMAERRNDATSCGGTYEVVEKHVCECSLRDLVKKPGTIELVDKNGRPSPLLSKLMSRDILREVCNLHDKGKAHRHLCSENILICPESRKTELRKGLHYYAKLRLNSRCLKSSTTGDHVSEWQAPEQRKDHSRPTFSANIYSFGEIFHYCITREHSKPKEWKTVGKKRDLPLVDCPEAKDLILRSQEERPESRPKANELWNHPLFWTPEWRLSFLHKIMSRPSYSKYSNLWNKLQKLSVRKVTCGEWNENIHDDNVLGYILEQKSNPEGEKTHEQNKKSEQKKNLGSKQNKEEACKYKFDSVLDLVRLIRNMKEHYRDLPKDVKESVGESPKDFDGFFTRRFPNLLIEVYKVVRECCKDDEHFRQFFSGDALVA